MEPAGLPGLLKNRFGMETRPNDLTPELIKALRKAGLTSLLLGIESAPSNLLDRPDRTLNLLSHRHIVLGGHWSLFNRPARDVVTRIRLLLEKQAV